jgi:carbon monoxide dehydrogenase subunit G
VSPRVRLAIVATVVAVVAVLGPAAPAAAADQATSVDVTETAGVYTVAATFSVDEPARAALAVLTDYPGIPRFMPEVESSSVVARRSDGALVDQAVVARFLMFTRRIQLRLDITERPGWVHFRDTSGESFEHYDGSWTVAASGDRTRITYALAAKPSFDVPEFLLRRLLKRDAVRMITRLRTEIAARAASPSLADCRSAACQ